MIVTAPYHLGERLAPLPVEGAELTPELSGDVWQRLRTLNAAVAGRVAAAATVPTVVSGDCLVALGVVAGAQRAGHAPFVVWFDAHGDVNTLDTSTSGYPGGMALRLVLGAHPELTGALAVPVADALLVDGRDLDPPEAAYLAADGPRRCAVDEVADALPADRPIVLHVDVDTVDGAELPGLRFPTPGGPSAARVTAAVRAVLATGRVVARHVACTWDPAASDEPLARLLAELTG